MTTAPHLVLSMDTGIDDALALAYLVAAGARIDAGRSLRRRRPA